MVGRRAPKNPFSAIASVRLHLVLMGHESAPKLQEIVQLTTAQLASVDEAILADHYWVQASYDVAAR